MGLMLPATDVVLKRQILVFHPFASFEQLRNALRDREIRQSTWAERTTMALPFPFTREYATENVLVSAESLGLKWDARYARVRERAAQYGFVRGPWQTGHEYCIDVAGNQEVDTFVQVVSRPIPYQGRYRAFAVSNYQGRDTLSVVSQNPDTKCLRNTLWLFRAMVPEIL